MFYLKGFKTHYFLDVQENITQYFLQRISSCSEMPFVMVVVEKEIGEDGENKIGLFVVVV